MSANVVFAKKANRFSCLPLPRSRMLSSNSGFIFNLTYFDIICHSFSVMPLLLARASQPPLSAPLSPLPRDCYQRKLLIMINHVSEIKAINLPVVTSSREREPALVCARCPAFLFSLRKRRGGWFSQLVESANRLFKTLHWFRYVR